MMRKVTMLDHIFFDVDWMNVRLDISGDMI